MNIFNGRSKALIAFVVFVVVVNSALAGSYNKQQVKEVTENAYKLIQQEEFHQAYQLLKPLADKGDPEANYQLGQLYHSADKKRNPYFDREKSRAAYYIAAKAGIPISQSALASNLIYYKAFNGSHLNKGGMKILKEACEWYRKAAMNGLSMGEFDVARCYERGWVTGKKDFVLAYAWYASAEILHKGEPLYTVETNQYKSNSMAAIFMQQAAQQAKLTKSQIKTALKKAKKIALAIKSNVEKRKGAKQH